MKLTFQPNLNILTHLYSLARAAMTKYTDGVVYTTEIDFLSVLEFGSLKPRCHQGWLLLRPLSLVGSQLPSLCVFSYDLGRGTPGITSFSYKESSHMGLRPTLMTSFNLNYLCKGPISTYSHIGEGAGMGFNIQILRRYNSVHSTMGKEMRN